MSAPPYVPHMEFESALRSSAHSDLLLYRAVRNYRSVEAGRPYVARVWNRDGLADVERDRLVELLGAMATHHWSPLLLRVHDVVVDDQGRLVVVQEHVPGGSFRRHYRVHRFSLQEVLSLGIRLSAALTVLHRHTAHGRVGPSTVLFRSSSDDAQHLGEPVLGGLEAAEVADSAGWGPWRSRWASPRVRSGGRAGDRSDDLYSVAAVMCSALTGAEPPASAEEVPEMLRPDVPQSLVEFLRSVMEPASRLRPVAAQSALDGLRKIEAKCGYPPTRSITSSGFSDADRQFGFVAPSPATLPPPVLEPPPGPVPGHVEPRPAGDPPGGPFPRFG